MRVGFEIMTVRPYRNYRCVGYEVIYTYFVARQQSLHFLGYKSVAVDKNLLERKRGERTGV